MEQIVAALKQAERQKTIKRANKAARYNRKLYLPAGRPQFLPNPADVFQKIPYDRDYVKFTHPLKGKPVTYTRRRNGLA